MKSPRPSFTLITLLCSSDSREVYSVVGHRDWGLRHRPTFGSERASVPVVSIMIGCRVDRFAVGFERAAVLFD